MDFCNPVSHLCLCRCQNTLCLFPDCGLVELVECRSPADSDIQEIVCSRGHCVGEALKFDDILENITKELPVLCTGSASLSVVMSKIFFLRCCHAGAGCCI